MVLRGLKLRFGLYISTVMYLMGFVQMIAAGICGGLLNDCEQSESLNPDEFVAETVDSDVAVSVSGLRAFIEPWEVRIEAAAISIVVNDDVFAGGKCFGVEVFNSDAVVGWFVPRVDSWLGIGHRSVVLVLRGFNAA